MTFSQRASLSSFPEFGPNLEPKDVARGVGSSRKIVQCLGCSVNDIVVNSVGKAGHLFDEIIYPRCRLRQKNPSRFD